MRRNTRDYPKLANGGPLDALLPAAQSYLENPTANIDPNAYNRARAGRSAARSFDAARDTPNISYVSPPA